jgi:hypothetical protein
MNLVRFETGIQRLYYIAWAIIFAACVLIAGGELFAAESRIREAAPGPAVLAAIAAAIVPLIAMHVIRWVYRGFVPKPI